MDDILFKKWNEWSDIIYWDVHNTLSITRYVFRKVKDIVENNPKINKYNVFYEFLGSVYIRLALMGVWRHVKIKKDSISFAGILEEIYKNPEILSREHFVNLYKEIGEDEDLASEEFDDRVGKGRSYVDPDQVNSDLKKLKEKAKKCEKYADWSVAHIDKRAIKEFPPFKESEFQDLDSCIYFLGKLVKKYYFLIRALDLPILRKPLYDWKAIFREQWLP